MDRVSVITLNMAKKYTDTSISGGGAIKGKNCQIKSSTPITGGTRIVFAWYLDNDTEQTTTVDVMNGIDGQDGAKGDTGNGVKSASIVENHLILTLDDDTTVDAGLLTNLDTTFEHIADISLNNLVDGQILKFNAITGKWENASAGTVDTSLVDLNDVDVDNLTDGQIIVWDATAGRWKNANNSPSITVDPTPTQGSNNAVASGGVYTALQGKADSADVPTKISDLTNDSDFIETSSTAGLIKNDGTVDSTSYATASSVSAITDGQSIDSFSDVETALASKADSTDVPTKTSDLTNDSNFVADASYVHTDNNYTSADKTIVGGVTAALSDKVDKVSGKGLSTNDYTTAEQTKLAGITTGATRSIKREYSLDINSWVAGNDGYYYTILFNPVLDDTYPVNVKLGTTGNGNHPTDNEVFAYNEYIYGGELQGSSVEEGVATGLVLYADDIPASKDGTPQNLKIWVEGIVKEVQ